MIICNLQLLRIIAALSVVYLHILSSAGFNLPHGFGSFGVDVFFVISGFTISYAQKAGPVKFFLRRVIRIVPFYWMATIGTFLVAYIFPHLVQSNDANWRNLLCSLCFIPYVNKVGNMEPMLPLGWFLNYLMYFYLLFTISLRITVRFAPILCSGLMISIALVIHLILPDNQSASMYSSPIIFEFIYGVLAYYLVQSVQRSDLKYGSIQWIKPLLCLAIISVALFLPYQELTSYMNRSFRAGIPSLFLVLSVVLLETVYGVALRGKVVSLLAESSYILYLFHPFVVYGFIRLLLPPASDMSMTVIGLTIVFLLTIATIVAVIMHVILERPILSALRRWTTS